VAQAEKPCKQSEYQERQAQLQYYRISAPFAGTVGNIPVKGDCRDFTQLTTITQNRPLGWKSLCRLSEPRLRTGMPVELLNGRQSVGTSRVFFIAPNTAIGTPVKSLFDNSKNQLRADQYVRAGDLEPEPGF